MLASGRRSIAGRRDQLALARVRHSGHPTLPVTGIRLPEFSPELDPADAQARDGRHYQQRNSLPLGARDSMPQPGQLLPSYFRVILTVPFVPPLVQ